MRRRRGILRAADLFCGAGGTSTGAELTGRVQVVLAVNCWPTAIASHAANHPHAMHICRRIELVDPRHDATLPEFDLLMASPECTHHSIARGGRPIDDQRRATPWDVLNWVSAKRPAWVLLENVREFRDWGPLVQKRDGRGRMLCQKDGSPWMVADPKRKGHIFKAWLAALESLGYQVDCQLLNAADYGAATNRTRLFVLARRGWSRRHIPWPEVTHPKGQWRPAWSVIDWSKPCPSIFGRKRPLAEKTLRRIEIGIRKFCTPEAAEAFQVIFRGGMDSRDVSETLATITAGAEHHGLAVPFQFKAIGRNPGATRSIDEPVQTIVACRANHAVVVPFLTPHFGERDGQTPRTHDAAEPLPTITGQGAGSLCMPFMLPRQGFWDCHRDKPGRSIDEPIPTITANHGPGHVVMPFLVDYHGGTDPRRDGTERSRGVGQPIPVIPTENRYGLVSPFMLAINHGGDDDRSRSIEAPMGTLTTKTGHSLVVPFLTKYYGTGGVASVGEPVDTVTARDRFGLAMASLLETMAELRVVDIGFRMLDVDELARAQGFPEGYQLFGSKADRVRQVGNSVSPAVAQALCETIADAA